MSILIVESPAKCKKIQSFLDKSYIVKSSVGHIRTLDTKWANTDVKITDDFEPPFITIKDKHEVVNNLKSGVFSLLSLYDTSIKSTFPPSVVKLLVIDVVLPVPEI